MKKVVKLVPPPRATKDNIIGTNFGIRPFRKGGLRLECEHLNNKIFFHNYGHGGAGVSLAYGCAKYTVDSFKQQTLSENVTKVAVLGSGYMGLMESILLADLGKEVTVYAKTFPKGLGVYENEPCITSQVAGGLWLPYGLDITDKPRHFSLGRTTFEYYKKCIEEKKYKGLSYKEVYRIDEENIVDNFCEPGLIKAEEVAVDFGNGVLHNAINFRSILMDGDVFLNELFAEAKQKNVKFVTKTFKDLDDVCGLSEKYIFNCSGSASRFLFNDENIVPIVGHILYLKKVEGADYFLNAPTKDRKMSVSMYPQSYKTAIGLTSENRGWLDRPDPESIKKLIANLDEFVEWRVGKPILPKL